MPLSRRNPQPDRSGCRRSPWCNLPADWAPRRARDIGWPVPTAESKPGSRWKFPQPGDTVPSGSTRMNRPLRSTRGGDSRRPARSPPACGRVCPWTSHTTWPDCRAHRAPPSREPGTSDIRRRRCASELRPPAARSAEPPRATDCRTLRGPPDEIRVAIPSPSRRRTINRCIPTSADCENRANRPATPSTSNRDWYRARGETGL